MRSLITALRSTIVSGATEQRIGKVAPKHLVHLATMFVAFELFRPVTHPSFLPGFINDSSMGIGLESTGFTAVRNDLASLH